MTRRTETWKRLVVAGVLAGLVGGIGFAACGGGKSDDAATTTTSAQDSSTPSDSTPAGSAAGKPCVAVADPLPAGAPAVPVKVGPAPTSLLVEDITPGTGAAAAATSTVTVDYIGVSCSTGKIFDDSYSRGQTATFPLDQVIPGWTQGLTGMKVGGTRLLGIPADLAYGDRSPSPDIAPGETLWFVVQMKGVQ
jgi:peptidylprolyl isomerase